jgi:hypothetical protein
MKQILLAWYPWPGPHGTSLFAEDLADRRTATKLMGASLRYRAHVTPQGWQFLWNHYALNGLLQLTRAAAWFDSESDDEAAAEIIRRSILGGYDPQAQRVSRHAEELVNA